MSDDDYRDLNRAMWDERAPAHAAAPAYQRQRFLDDPQFLSEVVRFDLPRLGDIAGTSAVHLQCHIGTDTISLHRLGASMTGLDFSPASIQEARRLATDTRAEVAFVEGAVDDAVALLGAEAFDLVYTGVGALNWLPSVDRWAGVVAALLRPGGRLFIREGHPMLDALDDRTDGLLAVEFPYFERPEPMVFESADTYVATDVPLSTHRSMEWSHGLGQMVTALLERDMVITGLVEHDDAPWEAQPGLMDHDPDTGEWRLRDRPWRLAATYTLQAVKPA